MPENLNINEYKVKMQCKLLTTINSNLERHQIVMIDTFLYILHNALIILFYAL